MSSGVLPAGVAAEGGKMGKYERGQADNMLWLAMESKLPQLLKENAAMRQEWARAWSDLFKEIGALVKPYGWTWEVGSDPEKPSLALSFDGDTLTLVPRFDGKVIAARTGGLDSDAYILADRMLFHPGLGQILRFVARGVHGEPIFESVVEILVLRTLDKLVPGWTDLPME